MFSKPIQVLNADSRGSTSAPYPRNTRTSILQRTETEGFARQQLGASKRTISSNNMALNDKMSLVAAIVAIAVLLVSISTTTAQGPYNNYYAEKPGSCAPPLPVQICIPTCYADGDCQGIGKCCPTNCGGTICARPVTMRKPTPVVKAGSCPVIPTGRWVCTPTCSSDGDCPGARKCCRNRCGAMACQKPEEQPVAPVDVPLGVNPGEERPAPNPFLVYMN